jgi:hypothetical protein
VRSNILSRRSIEARAVRTRLCCIQTPHSGSASVDSQWRNKATLAPGKKKKCAEGGCPTTAHSAENPAPAYCLGQPLTVRAAEKKKGFYIAPVFDGAARQIRVSRRALSFTIEALHSQPCRKPCSQRLIASCAAGYTSGCRLHAAALHNYLTRPLGSEPRSKEASRSAACFWTSWV